MHFHILEIQKFSMGFYSSFAGANENLDLQTRSEHVGAKSEGTEGSEGTRQKEVVSHRWMASSLHWNMHLHVQV